MKTVSFGREVPYYAQVASPELAEKIFFGELKPELDPRWAETGAKDPAEYAYWVDRACGIVCLKMCIEALGGREESLMYWINKGLAMDGYLIRKGKNGEEVELGWIHAVLSRMIEQEGFKARACKMDTTEIAESIRQGMLIIASVTCQLGMYEEITRNDGHLVVIHAFRESEEGLSGFILHNPSGRNAAMQQSAFIPLERFTQGYSGRVVQVSF